MALCIAMKTKRHERIELLETVEDIVGKTVQTDREMYNYSVRRENRKLKKVLKELKEWRENLEKTQRLLDAETKLDKRQEAHVNRRPNNHQ